MALKEDLSSEVAQIFAEEWDVQKTSLVPEPENLRLGNHAKDLERATVLYADLDGSTSMVDNNDWRFSAEVYKAYLRCSARIIKWEDGVVTAYDGDRIMAIFTGELKNTRAVRAAMKIHHAVKTIINPSLAKNYPTKRFEVNHVIGIDTAQLRAARIGVRGYNDLVWIGRAANYAAKLTSLPGKPIWITHSIYNEMNNSVKLHNDTGANMWEKRTWTKMNNMEIYCTTYSHVI